LSGKFILQADNNASVCRQKKVLLLSPAKAQISFKNVDARKFPLFFEKYFTFFTFNLNFKKIKIILPKK